MKRLLFLGAFLGGALASGCLIENKAHCGNQDGDATCRERGTGMFCSICTADNDGCVAQLPEDSCQAGSGSGSATDATTSTTVGTTQTTDTDTETTGPTTTGPGTESTTSSSTTDTSMTATDTTTGSTTMMTTTGASTGDLCGNGSLDTGESCDGDKFDPSFDTCAKATNSMKLGGMMGCDENCQLDTSMCCLATGQDCTLGGCCNGLTCGLAPMTCG